MKLKQKIIAKLDKKYGDSQLYNRLKSDYLFRTIVLSSFGTAITTVFAVYNGLMGIFNSSIWHSVFAIYLVAVAIQRLLVVLVYKLVSKRCGGDGERLERAKLKIYLANGTVFLPITIALTVVISLLISAQKPVISDEILAITTAAFAFYKIIVAIINFTRAKAKKDPIAQTIRNICLVDAIVSIILLESTLVTAFGELTHEFYMLITVSGLGGCTFALAVGIYMIITGAIKLHKNKVNSTQE